MNFNLLSYDHTSIIAVCLAGSMLAMLIILFTYGIVHLRQHIKETRDQPPMPAWMTNSSSSSSSIWDCLNVSSISLPLLLRWSFVLTCGMAIFLAAATVIAPLLYVSIEDSADSTLHVPNSDWSRLKDDSLSKLCKGMSKMGVAAYLAARMFSLLFFFILQRSVRPNGPLAYLEKQALVAVGCIVPYIVFVSIFTEGAQFRPDGTCMMMMPVPMLVANLFADGGLVVTFLTLYFYQLYQLSRSNRIASLEAPTSCQGIGKRAGVILEGVLRKHSISMAAISVTSLVCMALLLFARLMDRQRLSKLLPILGLTDILFTCLIMTYSLYKPRSSSIEPSDDDKHTRMTSSPINVDSDQDASNASYHLAELSSPQSSAEPEQPLHLDYHQHLPHLHGVMDDPLVPQPAWNDPADYVNVNHNHHDAAIELATYPILPQLEHPILIGTDLPNMVPQPLEEVIIQSMGSHQQES